MSRDHRLAGPGGAQVRISSDEDWARVQALRAEVDAVLVGSGTVLLDDPRLTARTDPPPARQPIRVVLDRRGRVGPKARVTDDAAETLILSDAEPSTIGHASRTGVGRPITLAAVLDHLQGLGLDRVLVEPGPTLLDAFLRTSLWDRWTVYEGPDTLDEGPTLGPIAEVALSHASPPKEWGGGRLWTVEHDE